MIDTEKNYSILRDKMVVQQIEARGIFDQRVLAAMRNVPRHLFIPNAFQAEAYADHPLPIGYDQTISQPYIVAEMTQLLELGCSDRVLEVGTGSGYQTAILAEMASHVYTIERIPELLCKAQKCLSKLQYNNITTKLSDGTLGWPEEGLFNAIIVTAGAPHVPSCLKDQLADAGRLVIPVGDAFSQVLLKIVKKGHKIIEKDVGGCRFVKLIGSDGWQSL